MKFIPLYLLRQNAFYMKATKAPDELLGAPFYHNFIALNAVNIIESCTHTRDKKGTMFLTDRMLLFVLKAPIRSPMATIVIWSGRMKWYC